MKKLLFLLIANFLFAIEINIFGISNHFYKPVHVSKKLKVYNRVYLNPGIGFSNKIDNTNFRVTFNYLKNCYNKNTYLIGSYYKFNINKIIDFNLGLIYYKTKYVAKITKIIPFYFISLKTFDNFKLNFSIIPAISKKEKKKYLSFIFFSKKI